MSRHEVDVALQRLLDLELVAMRPWRVGGADGVWQLMTVPRRQDRVRVGHALSVGELLRGLGFPAP
jgi:hypothetical protein